MPKQQIQQLTKHRALLLRVGHLHGGPIVTGTCVSIRCLMRLLQPLNFHVHGSEQKHIITNDDINVGCDNML